MQDVAFCQCLRNIIDALTEYVNTTHPSPEEFMRHLLPDTSGFKKPYTEEEKEIIDSNEAKVKRYVAWIEAKIENKRRLNDSPDSTILYPWSPFDREPPLTGGDKWEDLDAIHMVWQDEAHTPDPDNLDLLLGPPVLGETIKRDGRVYEYRGTPFPDGLAKGFFESEPAKCIRAAATQCAMQTVERNGFFYDSSRFEYDATADKCGRMELWKLQQRVEVYVALRKQYPAFYKVPWSIWTRKKTADQEKEQGRLHLSKSLTEIMEADGDGRFKEASAIYELYKGRGSTPPAKDRQLSLMALFMVIIPALASFIIAPIISGLTHGLWWAIFLAFLPMVICPMAFGTWFCAFFKKPGMECDFSIQDIERMQIAYYYYGNAGGIDADNYAVMLKKLHKVIAKKQKKYTETNRRNDELGAIADTLTKEEEKTFEKLWWKEGKPWKVFAPSIALILSVILFFGGLGLSSKFESNLVAIIFFTILAGIGFTGFIISGAFGCTTYLQYLRMLQAAYYTHNGSDNAKKYEELLQRIPDFAADRVITIDKKQELTYVYCALTSDERKELKRISETDGRIDKRRETLKRSIVFNIAFIVLWAVTILLLLLIFFLIREADIDNTINMAIACSIYASTAFLLAVWCAINLYAKESLKKNSEGFYYLKQLQSAYYAKDGSDNARKYEELLKRLNK